MNYINITYILYLIILIFNNNYMFFFIYSFIELKIDNYFIMFQLFIKNHYKIYIFLRTLMSKYFSFSKPRCFIHLILLIIYRTINDIIRKKYVEFFQSSFLRLFLMFFSKSLALTLYLFQQILMKHINSYSLIKRSKSNKWKLWFFMIIVIYNLNVLFASLNYEPFFLILK
jgi:hypothetical protein